MLDESLFFVAEFDMSSGCDILGSMVFAVMAASSTMTDGNLPRVYDAVNSHGSPALRHNAHGHLPVHLVFFLGCC